SDRSKSQPPHLNVCHYSQNFLPSDHLLSGVEPLYYTSYSGATGTKVCIGRINGDCRLSIENVLFSSFRNAYLSCCHSEALQHRGICLFSPKVMVRRNLAACTSG